MCVFAGSLLDFLKSDEGNRVQLPKLIDFSAQVRVTQLLSDPLLVYGYEGDLCLPPVHSTHAIFEYSNHFLSSIVVLIDLIRECYLTRNHL